MTGRSRTCAWSELGASNDSRRAAALSGERCDTRTVLVMFGVGGIALGAAPIAGGLLLGAAAGNINRPNPRAGIKEDLELLERLPDEQVDRRAALMGIIEHRIDALIAASEQRRELQRRTRYFTEKGNWRDLVVFISAVLFAVVCWQVDHHRAYWLPLFVITILMATVTGLFVLGSFAKSVRAAPQPRQRPTTR
jgi:hypothetical protein